MSKTVKFLGMEFFAEDGVIYVINEEKAANVNLAELPPEQRTKYFKGLPPKSFMKKALTIGLIAYHSWPPSRQAEAVRFLQAAEELFKQAKEQGAFDDPKADAWKIRHKPFRKSSILVPSSVSAQIFLEKYANKTPQQIMLSDED